MLELDIILRTCSRSEVQVHEGDRIHSKEEVLIRCLKSVRNSINDAESNGIKLIIVDDHSDPYIVKRLKESCDEFIPLNGSTGNSASLHAAYNYAKDSCHDLIYFLEDDYLHELGAVEEMVEFYYTAKEKMVNKEIAVYPVDYNDRYKPEGIRPCFIVPGKNRYWRTIDSTTGTFLIAKETLIRDWRLFETFAECGLEESTINKIWRGVNGVICFSPIPTLAYHLQAERNLPLYSNYKPLWDSLQE